MYGQLKSTVRCLDCGNISVTFDPFLTLSLPITRPTLFHVALVPYEFSRKGTASSSDEEDPDFKSGETDVMTEHFVFRFTLDAKEKTTVGDLKK